MARTPWGLGRDNMRLYHVWNGMKARCYNPNHQAFASYGGRGIQICDHWRDSFSAFLEDMGDPGAAYTLERNNVNGNYEPSNCRWATRAEQALNTSRSLILEFSGLRLTAHEWAKKVGIAPKTLRKRLYDGWTVERALTTPIRAS